MHQVNLELAEIAHHIDKICSLPGQERLSRLVTDSRKLREGDVFICLRGETFDGHQFAAEALQKKARYIIYERSRVDRDFPGLQVKDCNHFLGILARTWRRKVNPRIIGITGSNGKTSTKEICYALFKSVSKRVQKTAKNLNNNFGVAYTLLDLKADTDYLVCEIGTNHPGEIAELSRLAEPDMAILVSIAGSHLGNFGSIENIAREKAGIIAGMKSGKLFVLPDLAFLNIVSEIVSRSPVELAMVGAEGFSNILHRPEASTFQYEGIEYRLGLPGRHQFSNMLLALACLKQYGLPVKPALANLVEISNDDRLSPETVAGITLWNDTYNANRASFEAAYDTVMAASGSGNVHVAMGEMAELGEFSLDEHLNLLKKMEGASLYFSGRTISDNIKKNTPETVKVFNNGDEDILKIADAILSQVKPGDHILVKGSRSSRMERLVILLRERITAQS